MGRLTRSRQRRPASPRRRRKAGHVIGCGVNASIHGVKRRKLEALGGYWPKSNTPAPLWSPVAHGAAIRVGPRKWSLAPRPSWTASYTMRRASPLRAAATVCATRRRRPRRPNRIQNQPMRRPARRPKKSLNQTPKCRPIRPTPLDGL